MEKKIATLMKAIPDEKWEEVATCLWLGFTPEQVKESKLPFDLLTEIITGGYTDTDQRDQITDHVCLHYVGLCAPCFGDEKEYQVEFCRRMELLKKGEWKNDE